MCAACDALGVEVGAAEVAGDRSELEVARQRIRELEDSAEGLDRLLDAQADCHEAEASRLHDRIGVLMARVQAMNGYAVNGARMRNELQVLVANAERWGSSDLLLAGVQSLLSEYGTVYLQREE